MRAKKSKKAVAKSIFVFVVSFILFALSAYILTGTVIAKKNNQPFQFFGISLHVVVTDSMTPEIKVGDYLIAKKIDISQVKIGDDVLFISPDPNLKGKMIVHRVVAIATKDGNIELTTQGIKAGAPQDKYPVKEIVGIKLVNSTFLGKLYQMVTTPFGIITILVVFLCLVVGVGQVKKIAKQVAIEKKAKKDKENEKEENEKKEIE